MEDKVFEEFYSLGFGKRYYILAYQVGGRTYYQINDRQSHGSNKQPQSIIKNGVEFPLHVGITASELLSGIAIAQKQ